MFNLYPYTDFHEINLDWIIRKIKELGQAFNDFEAVNKITNAGAWDITKQYQAWTVVSDNNIGYISLKPVPAGVAITNTEYWGLVADYDILITDLSERISELEALNTKAIQQDNNLIVISDSYGMNIPENFIYFLTNYWNSAFGAGHIFTSAVSGSSMIQSIEYPDVKNFYRQLTETIEPALAAANVQKSAIKYIVIAGGYNDSHWSTTVEAITAWRAAARDFHSYVKANYPNARIILAYLGWQLYSNNSYYPLNDPIGGYELYKAHGMAEGFEFLENSECCLLPDGCIASDDPFHPTRNGALSISDFLFHALTTGCSDKIYSSTEYHTWLDTTEGAFETNEVGTVTISLHNRQVKMEALAGESTGGSGFNMELRSTSPVTIPALGEVKIGKIPETIGCFNTINSCSVCEVTSASGLVPAVMRIANDRSVYVQLTGGATTTYMYIRGFKFIYDPFMKF